MNEVEMQMGTKKIFPLLLTMAIPPMISMFIQSMYNIVDSIFVSRLGENAITAVSIAFPMQNLVLSVAVGLGVGLNACIAMNLGAKNEKVVNTAATNGLILTAIHSLVFIIIGLFFVKPYLRMFTQSEEVLRWGTNYCRIVICFSFGSLFHINIEKLFQATGNMVVPMILQVVGALINIILDPILIFGMFGFPAMGVTGAAIATVIGQISAGALALILFFRRSKIIKISFKEYKLNKEVIKRIYSVGVPSGIMMALPSVLVSILNGILNGVSQTAVAVFGLYYKVQTFVYMPSGGVVQGMRPIISYNYGAGLKDRVKRVLKVSTAFVAGIMLAGTVVFMLAPDKILSMFNAEGEMLSMGVNAFRIISLGFVASSVGLIFAGGFEALSMGKKSLIITALRQIIIIPLLSLILVNIIGIDGVWISFPIAEIISAIFAVVFMKNAI